MPQEQARLSDVSNFRHGFWPDVPKLKAADSSSKKRVASLDRFFLGLFPGLIPAVAKHQKKPPKQRIFLPAAARADLQFCRSTLAPLHL
jgi:hypothetical protein